MLELDEVRPLASLIGANWRSIGNALKFSFVELDYIVEEQKKKEEAGGDPLREKVQLMLAFWVGVRGGGEGNITAYSANFGFIGLGLLTRQFVYKLKL